MGRTDAELIAACTAGETAAFGEIVARYQRAVVAVAYVAVRDRALAEDIAQDAFVIAWGKLAALHDPERLPAWLCGIARNVARARRRTRGREVGETDVAGDTTPFTSLDDAEREAALAAALARVPETYREPLVLVYCEQQSAKDVARALGTSDAAVHQRLSRGRAMLASDARLVEHAGPRSRRDLAAAVLAAIALGVGSSRVEATPRGPSMLKLTAIALTASLAAGTTYVVARGTSESSKSSTATATQLVRKTAPDVHARAAAGTRLPFAPFRPARPMAQAAGSGALTCNEVATHMANLSFAADTSVPPGPLHDQVVAEVATHFEEACEQNQWSQGYMACALGAPDPYSMMLDCASYLTMDDTGIPFTESDDSTIVIPSRTDPIAPSTDSSCSGVAQHMAELTMPDPAELAKHADPKHPHLDRAITAAKTTMTSQVEASCRDTAWPEARRTCIAAATTVEQMSACQ